MDVVTAFLNRKLDIEAFVNLPKGVIFPNIDPTEYVLKLNKALYGLKQAPRAWYKVIDEFIIKFGLFKSLCDPAIYYAKDEKSKTLLMVAIYVDDLLIIGSDM
jgi:hypothetical protein